MSFGEKQGFSGHLFLMYCNWLFVQVPSSQRNQRNQTIEFSWVALLFGSIFSFVVHNLCLDTYRRNLNGLQVFSVFCLVFSSCWGFL